MQHQTVSHPVSLFCVSASADATLLAQWETHLLPLQQTGLLTFWSERHLLGGEDRTKQSVAHLDQADCILFLMSADFFADDACLNVMQHALLRKQTSMVVIIPLLLRSVEWQESDLGSLSCLPTNGVPITGWPDPDEAFHVCLRELRALLDLPLRVRRVSKHERVRTNKNRERMLRRLSRSYQNLLDQSLQGIAWMELGLTKRPNAVQNATNLTLRIAQQPEQPLAPGVSIIQVYEDAEQELLILGEPGAGKSTELLHLAKYLVAQAEQEEIALLPVILPLSSWATKQRELADWIIEEITQVYDVPRRVSQQWMEQEQVLPMLDGLDEVEEQSRFACIRAINTYHRTHLTPLVVCSRTVEYENVTNEQRLMLQSAITVRPLTREQIDRVLEQLGEAGVVLQNALDRQPELEELATSPLMLSILILTYQGTTIPTNMPNETALEQQVWTDYVQRMVERKGNAQYYPLKQTRTWLNWLARQMLTHNQTIWYAEYLHADWLTERQQQQYNWLAIRIPAIIMGILITILIWFSLAGPSDLVTFLLVGMVGGFLGGWICQHTSIFSDANIHGKKIARLPSSILLGILCGASLGLNLGTQYSLSDWLCDASIYGLVIGLSGWLFQFFLSRVPLLQTPELDSQNMRWQRPLTWFNTIPKRHFLTSALFGGIAIGLSTGLSTGLSFGLTNSNVSLGLNIEWANGLTNGLTFGLMHEMVLGQLTGLTYGPNFGLTNGLVYGLTYGLISGLSLGLTGYLISLILTLNERSLSLAERLHWNWRALFSLEHFRRSITVAITILLIVGLINGSGAGLGTGLMFGNDKGLDAGLYIGLSSGLFSGLLYGLGYWLLFGLYQGLIQERLADLDRRAFNQGIRRTLWNGATIGWISGGILSGIIILSYGLSVGLTPGLSFNYGLSPGISGLFDLDILNLLSSEMSYGWLLILCGGLVVWATVGGLTVLRHYVIRLLLACSNTFPWRAQKFLDNASAHILMRRVGGGYSFVHRRLLDYFADTAIVPANRSNVVYQNPSVPPSMSDSLPESARSEDL